VPDLVTRFAPAPTGYLHLGHVLNATYVWGIARGTLPGTFGVPPGAGRVLLRIEDHDRQRSRREFETAIIEDLEWLGFAADEPLVRQSERGAVYEGALEQLRQRALVYACDCSRADLAGPRYAGTCRARGLRETPGVGLRVRIEPTVERFEDWRHGPVEQHPEQQCGDLLVRDRGGNWTYHFAAVVDDWTQRVTLVIRGDDLLDSTGRQIQLARLLGRPEPPAYLHHPLIMKTPAQKLSKSDGDTGVRDLRARGWTAEEVIARAIALGAAGPAG
jgi:glutamyl-tRNA synthetase/glutamyl-Q tRNA(Asp) synthetase